MKKIRDAIETTPAIKNVKKLPRKQKRRLVCVRNAEPKHTIFSRQQIILEVCVVGNIVVIGHSIAQEEFQVHVDKQHHSKPCCDTERVTINCRLMVRWIPIDRSICI